MSYRRKKIVRKKFWSDCFYYCAYEPLCTIDRICPIIRSRQNHFCCSHCYWKTGKSRRIEFLYSASSISIGGEVGWMAVAAAVGFRGWRSSNVAISFHRSCLTAIVSPAGPGSGRCLRLNVTER